MFVEQRKFGILIHKFLQMVTTVKSVFIFIQLFVMYFLSIDYMYFASI